MAHGAKSQLVTPDRFSWERLEKEIATEIWSQLEAAYAGADIADNWEALFRTMVLFRQVATEVGKGLDYEYPIDLDERVTAFVKEMQRRR